MQNKFGAGKAIGFFITFPFVVFLIFIFFSIPINLYRSYTQSVKYIIPKEIEASLFEEGVLKKITKDENNKFLLETYLKAVNASGYVLSKELREEEKAKLIEILKAVDYPFESINPIDLISGEDWNPNPERKSEKPSYGIGKIIKSSLRVSIETTIMVIPIALLFAFILLYLTPSWIRTLLEFLRDFLYLVPVILIAYIGYFYISPIFTGKAANLSGLLASRTLIIFAFPYAVFGFMYGLSNIWPSVNYANPTFSGRVFREKVGIGRIIAFICVIVLVALITCAKVFGETVIFSLLSGMSAPENFMDTGLASQNLSSTVFTSMNNINVFDEFGFSSGSNLFLGAVLFITIVIFMITFVVSLLSNLGLAIIGHIFNNNTNDIRTDFGKAPALRVILRLIFSIVGLAIVGFVVYLIIITLPSTEPIKKLITDTTLNDNIRLLLSRFDITDKGIMTFAINFIWYAILVGFPVGLFAGIVIKGYPLEHYVVSLLRAIDNVPIICVAMFGFAFFVLQKGADGLSFTSAGLTTALFLAPKIAILTYEAISTEKNIFEVVREGRPYISATSYIFIGFIKAIGSFFQVFGLMFGILVTIMFTGVTQGLDKFIPSLNAQFMAPSQQMFSLMSQNINNLETIKPVLNNYYIYILSHFALFFLIGCGIKFVLSIIESARLGSFHKKIK